jgi:hypothetical protein
MHFESKIVNPKKTTQCAAYGLTRDLETGVEPEHSLTLNHGETLRIFVNGPHDEVREIQVTVSGSVTLFEDVKTQDSFMVRRSKNVSVIGEKVTVGESQIV